MIVAGAGKATIPSAAIPSVAVADGTGALRRILRYAALDRRSVAGMLGTTAAMALVSAGVPLALSTAPSITTGDDPLLVYALVAGIFAVGVAVWALNRARAFLTKKLVAQTVLRIRLDALGAALRRDLNYYDRHGRPQIRSRLTNDLDSFGEATVSVLDMLSQMLVMVVLLPLLFYYSWLLALITIGSGVVIVVAVRYVRKRSRTSATRAAEATAELTAAVSESVEGRAVARAFNCEPYITAVATGRNTTAYRNSSRADLIASSLQPVLIILSGLTMAVLVLLGGEFTRSGLITVASWYLFLLAADRFTWLLATSAAIDGQIQLALAAVRRVFTLIDGDPETDSVPATVGPATAAAPRIERGHLVVDQVSMRYPAGVEALKAVSLEIPAGCHIGLVGPSGAGKSTLLKVLARLHPWQSGRIAVDGHPLQIFADEDYRAGTCYLPQRPQLFRGTVLDNIRIVVPEMTAERLTALVAEAGLEEWLATLPEGVGSEVGARGLRLSLGGRQIVAVLRALAKYPRLVLLDEPTANLDPALDEQVRQALRRLFAGRTCVMIAHRLSTMRDLDLVAVMDRGRLVELGPHDELAAGRGRYAALYDTYVTEQVHGRR